MKYFDIHSHLYFPDYDSDRDSVILNMKESGIYTTCIGTDIESSKKSVELAIKYDNIFATIGIHPDESNTDLLNTNYKEELEKLINHPKVVAVGECGFDFFRTSVEQKENVIENQREIFERQIELALKYNKALMLHSRPSKGSQDAYEETLNVLEKYAKEYGDKLFGNAHFFAGNGDILKRFLDIGFTVSFTGVITFTKDYDEVVRSTPLGSIHAETDAPFVAPIPYRGKRNSPEYIKQTVEAIARIKGENMDVVSKALVLNARKLFRLD